MGVKRLPCWETEDPMADLQDFFLAVLLLAVLMLVALGLGF